MTYFYLFIFLLFLFLFIRTRKEKTEEWMRDVKPLIPFLKIALCFFRYAKRIRRNRNGMKRRSVVSDDLKILYPDAAGKREQNYLLKKTGYVLLILFAGNLLALCLSISSRMEGKEYQAGYLKRNHYGEGDKEVTMLAALETKELSFEETVTVSVGEQEYTQEEAYAWIGQAMDLLPGLILAENEDFDHITSDLNLVKEIPDIPVSIQWKSDHYQWMDERGRITASELPEEGVLCMLTAVVSCQEYEKESILYVRICPPELSYEEQLKKDLEEVIREAESEDRTLREIVLPQEMGGTKIIWKKPKSDISVMMLAMTLLLAALIYPAMDRDLHKRVLHRNEEMARDYPELISKLVLFMGAGMTIRGAFHRIASDYERAASKGKAADGRTGESKRKVFGGRKGASKRNAGKSAYVEIMRVCHEIDSGVSEGQAYLNLGKRCEDQHYVRLSMLLAQNLRKGNSGLTELLEKEAAEAFEERKRNARRYGEEAGTKLLLPMMLMLLIVMVIIMVPAFMSFGG